MASLAYQVKGLCLRHPTGSKATQAQRVKSLCAITKQLKALGYKLKDLKNLKPKHAEALLNHWKGEGLSVGTIKNRMAHLRFLADAVGKPSLFKNNEEYGIERRQMHTGDKSQRLDHEKLATIPDEHIKLALRLQSAFGLRREEALKFKPSLADKGDKIALKASWCKGGRPRTIPITHPKQREILAEAHALAGEGSLIPAHSKYIEQLKKYENLTLKAGLKNNHGLRHQYAQWRYKVLTGMEVPAKSGTPFNQLTAQQKELDQFARLTISEELGHSRIEITNVYLGGRRNGQQRNQKTNK